MILKPFHGGCGRKQISKYTAAIRNQDLYWERKGVDRIKEAKTKALSVTVRVRKPKGSPWWPFGE